jgi:predicted porin
MAARLALDSWLAAARCGGAGTFQKPNFPEHPMKKTLLAAAVLAAFAGLAQAQTSVTLYGSFDAGVRNQQDVNSSGNSRTTMSSDGTYNSNRLGFKGLEDLGGGLNAHFTLESAFNSGTGATDSARFFGRSAFVGLGGQWGALDLGRQYTVAYKTVGAYDPFNFKYTGIIPTSQASISAGTRVDNDIQYTGTFGPLTARAEYALSERTGGGSGGSHAAVGATWASGPFSVGAAYTARKPDQRTAAQITANAAPDFQDNKAWTLGGAYTFGPAKIAAGYAKEKQDLAAGGSLDQKNAWVGGSYNLNPALALSAAYYHTKVDAGLAGVNADGKRGLFIVGGTYALSKRTNFYADVDYTKFKDGLAGTGSSPSVGQLPLASPNGQDRMVGFSVGVNHLF